MSKISSQGPQVSNDAERQRREDALADVKKGTQQKVEEVKSEAVTSDKQAEVKTTAKKEAPIKDGFAAKGEANKFIGAKADAAKIAAQFKQEFPEDVVAFLETNLKAKVDPEKTLKLKNQVSADPKAKQVILAFKTALEEGAQKVLQKQFEQSTLKADKDAKPSDLATKLEPKMPEVMPRAGEIKDAAKKIDDKGKVADAAKEAKVDDKKALDKKSVKDDAKTDKSEKPETPADKPEVPVDDAGAATGAATAEDGVEPPADPSTETTPVDDDSAPATGLSTGDPLLDDEGVAATGNSTPTDPPSWQGDSGTPLSANETRAVMQFRTWMDDMGTGEISEFALIVLMAAIHDTETDLKDAMKLLKMRHKVNDAMRNHYTKFMHEMAGLTGKDAREWQHMSYDIGYDENGEMCVQSFPDLSWQTSKYEDVPGKGADDMSPEESFVAAHGQDGLDEARQNGSLHHIDGDTVSGLTSHSMVKGETVQLEKDRMRSKLSEMKDESKKVTLKIQRAMDMRKNLLEQFSKIYDSRSDNWDQNIAMMLR